MTPDPIATINPVIGDLSFAVRYGRPPTLADEPRDRIATHLRFAEQLLRARDVSALSPELRARRTQLLDRLAAYAHAGRFPRGESRTGGRLPTWLDDTGTLCAVADMVGAAAGIETVRALDGYFHNAFVADFEAPAFDAFVASSGFTREELAIVQPSYEGPSFHPLATWQAIITASYAAALASGAAHSDHPQVGMLDFAVRYMPHHNDYIGDAIVAVDGGVGIATDDGAATPYRASIKIGSEMDWNLGMITGTCNGCGKHRQGATLGLEVDAIGDRVPRAWTIPLDAWWYLPQSPHFRVGLVAGARYTVDGANRGLGWSAGLDFVGRNLVHLARHVTTPNNLHVGLGVERIADLTFLGVSVGIAGADRYDHQYGEGD